MLITADQIRAARALKNWSQTDLAQRTGLAVPTIANIELGKQTPGKNTIEKIIDAFSIGGIAFTQNGVEFDKNEIFSLVGDGKFKNVLIDAINVLQKLPPKDRVFYALNAEDSLTTDEENELYDQMVEQGVTLKRIISQKAKILFHQFATRAIEHKYADENGAVFLFADKVAFYSSAHGDQEPSTLIITNERIAEIYKKTLVFMWDNLPEVKGTPVEPKKKSKK